MLAPSTTPSRGRSTLKVICFSCMSSTRSSYSQLHVSHTSISLSRNIVLFFDHSGSLIGWPYGGSTIWLKINKCVYWLSVVSLQDHTSIGIYLLIYPIGSFLLVATKPPLVGWEPTWHSQLTYLRICMCTNCAPAAYQQ